MDEFYYDNCGGYCQECFIQKKCPHQIDTSGEIEC